MAELDYLSLLESQVAAMATSLAAADPDAAVPACPDWKVRDLASHVIGVHTWVTSTLGNPKPGPYGEPPQEGDAAQLSGNYARAAQALVDRLHELSPDTPSWTFDEDNQTAGYWRRRQLQEISVHRWDVAPYDMDPATAADGIDEAVHFFVARQVARGRVTLPAGSLRLVTPEQTWTIGEGQPESVVEGSAPDLLLSLWGRKDLLPAPWSSAKLMP